MQPALTAFCAEQHLIQPYPLRGCYSDVYLCQRRHDGINDCIMIRLILCLQRRHPKKPQPTGYAARGIRRFPPTGNMPQQIQQVCEPPNEVSLIFWLLCMH